MSNLMHNNAPIIVLPPLPMGENKGLKQGIRLNFAPRAEEFNLLFNLPLALSETWGLDQKFCPTVREIACQEDQIPSYSPTFPGWGSMRQNFDRCMHKE